mmetsp:Transcript_19717/g.48407  ORF Transcript_19717/g.48407 Transcript_19717/m.48407 type:complete len:317 (-) Transcript_19717:196-1146(-)
MYSWHPHPSHSRCSFARSSAPISAGAANVRTHTLWLCAAPPAPSAVTRSSTSQSHGSPSCTKHTTGRLRARPRVASSAACLRSRFRRTSCSSSDASASPSRTHPPSRRISTPYRETAAASCGQLSVTALCVDAARSESCASGAGRGARSSATEAAPHPPQPSALRARTRTSKRRVSVSGQGTSTNSPEMSSHTGAQAASPWARISSAYALISDPLSANGASHPSRSEKAPRSRHRTLAGGRGTSHLVVTRRGSVGSPGPKRLTARSWKLYSMPALRPSRTLWWRQSCVVSGMSIGSHGTALSPPSPSSSAGQYRNS